MAAAPRPAPPREGAKAQGRWRRPLDVDRVVVMRAVLVVVVAAFLYLIFKVSMIAFGGSSAREAKRIERAVDLTPRREAAGAATAATAETAPAR